MGISDILQLLLIFVAILTLLVTVIFNSKNLKFQRKERIISNKPNLTYNFYEKDAKDYHIEISIGKKDEFISDIYLLKDTTIKDSNIIPDLDCNGGYTLKEPRQINSKTFISNKNKITKGKEVTETTNYKILAINLKINKDDIKDFKCISYKFGDVIYFDKIKILKEKEMWDKFTQNIVVLEVWYKHELKNKLICIKKSK